MTYTVVLLKGCFSQGDTLPEALDMAREAIGCYVESLKQHGEPVPEDVQTVAFEWGEAQEALVFRGVHADCCADPSVPIA